MRFQPKIRTNRLPAATPTPHTFKSEDDYLAAMIELDGKRGKIPQERGSMGGIPPSSKVTGICLALLTDQYQSPAEIAAKTVNGTNYIRNVLCVLAKQGRVEKRDAKSYRRAV